MRGRRIGGGGVIDSVVEEPVENRGASPISRSAILGHRGCIVWMTGLSGSGKSTLAQALEQRLLNSGILSAVLDGDVLRTGLSRNLGFTPDDRSENLRRATELAIHLADAGVVVIAALISPFRADRAMAAERAKERGVPFVEVFINASLSECERRDPKDLYKKARAGQIKQFTGIDSPYEAPIAPDPAAHRPAEQSARLARWKLLSSWPWAWHRPSEQAGAGADTYEMRACPARYTSSAPGPGIPSSSRSRAEGFSVKLTWSCTTTWSTRACWNSPGRDARGSSRAKRADNPAVPKRRSTRRLCASRSRERPSSG